MKGYNPDFYRTTYEYESNPLNKEFCPFKEEKYDKYKTSHERFSNSPPIILCETGSSRNNKNHRHRYLFYPSASRLSPFTDNNYFSEVNIIKNPIRNDNYTNIKKENENKNKLNNKNETLLNQNEKSPEKYQAMYDKSFELVKRISELVPEEETKIKGNAEYYLSKDKDYMNIIDKQIDSLTNHFKNNNFNLGYKTDGTIYKNNNNISQNDDNQMTYDQYKKNLLNRIKNSNTEINPNEYNFNYKQNDNVENNKEFQNNYENDINNNNRNYINDYINDLNNKNNQKIEKANIEVNQPEIDLNKNENYKNKNEKMNINDNKINNKEKEYENEEENNNVINNENNQLIENNLENYLNKENQNKKEIINQNGKDINKPNQYNTLGMIRGTNDNNNDINQYQNQPFNKNQNNDNLYNSDNIKNEDENPNNNYPYQLIEENNNQKIILSSENKPFLGELVDYQYQKGNQIFIKKKSGSDLKLSLLRGKEGEPLTYQGYPLMGNDNKFFYDKDGNIIVYPDNEFIKGDKSIQVGILDTRNRSKIMGFSINKNNFDLYGTGEEFEGSGSGGFKKSKKKNKWYMFPKGDGGAKPPVIMKRKKRKNKI